MEDFILWEVRLQKMNSETSKTKTNIVTQLLKYVFISAILLWSSMLFSSPFYLIFLCLFIGILSNFIDDDLDLLYRCLATLVVLIIFSLVYAGVAKTPPLSMGYRVDIILHNYRLIPRLIHNLKVLMFPGFIFIVSGILGSTTGSLLKRNLKTKKILALIFLTVFIINFCVSAFALNTWSKYDTHKMPPTGKYAFDGHIYLKTFYLVKSGMPYYKSFETALTQRKNGFTVTSVFNIRPPFVVFLWSIMPPAGINLIRLFMFFSAVLFIITFFTVLKDLKDPFLAILTPAIMAYLFFYGVIANWFTFHEYWAWFFLAIAIWVRRKKFYVPMMISFVLCLITRELFFFAWFLFTLFAIINKEKKELFRMGIILLASIAYYALHFFLLIRSVTIHTGQSGSAFSITEWFQSKVFFTQLFLRFGSVTIYKPVLFGLFILICYFVASYRIIKNRLTFYYPLLALPLVVLVYFKMGISARAYWGLVFLPAFAYVVPFAWYKMEKEESENPDTHDKDNENENENDKDINDTNEKNKASLSTS